MSGWLHPEGPESVVTYWSRRLVVIAAAVLAIVLGVVLVSTASSEPVRTAGPAPAATETPVSPSSSVSASPTSTPSSTPSSSPSPTATTPAPTSASPSSPSTTASAPATSPRPATPSKAVPVACNPADLRATLQGDPSPKVGQRVAFTLSLINGGDQPCTFVRTADSVELKIYSGTDRIWSTDDCPQLVRPVANLVKPEAAVAWRIGWDGARSATGCRHRPEVPRAGTYFATFQFTGAKPVQQRMLLAAG